jgi:pyrroloquinoline quinone (PQQ) biosynthesis protein C/mannose-6-phosphate isomerase-like protein (cupin superfamily)
VSAIPTIRPPSRRAPAHPVSGEHPARTIPVEKQLVELRRQQAEHPFWKSPLLAAFSSGALTREDLRYVFSQYYLYSKNFTRFIAAVMANCDSDLDRARLSENLWEEGGGCEPERRHAQIFRNFLKRSLDVDPESIVYAPYTRHFVREYLVQCLRAEPMSGAAFLSLGTEGIVARMYEILAAGLRKAGVPDEELEFFHIHMACDDEHAETLEKMMVSYADVPGWFDACEVALDRALELRREFFENIFDALQKRRLEPMLLRMQARKSLALGATTEAVWHRPGEATRALYANKIESENIDFTVERLPLAAEVLDPRMVRIPPGKSNEFHRHAHETLLHFIAGRGKVRLDDRTLDVREGDTVLVPRWAMHQTENSGPGEMRFLAVTDFNLTRSAYLGDPTDYRRGKDADATGRRD